LNKKLLKIAIKDAESLDEKYSDKDRAINFYKTALNEYFFNKNKMLKEIISFDKSRNQNFKDFLDPMLVDWLI
jgi:hypothetical protein